MNIYYVDYTLPNLTNINFSLISNERTCIIYKATFSRIFCEDVFMEYTKFEIVQTHYI